jgi:hypothetical protein
MTGQAKCPFRLAVSRACQHVRHGKNHMRRKQTMNSRWNRGTLALVPLAGLLVVIIAGCDGKAAPLTTQEKAQFSGGPMPESARQEMQKRLQQSKAASEQNRQATSTPGG